MLSENNQLTKSQSIRFFRTFKNECEQELSKAKAKKLKELAGDTIAPTQIKALPTVKQVQKELQRRHKLIINTSTLTKILEISRAPR